MKTQVKNLKYKLYQNRKNKKLHEDIHIAWEIYTHALSLPKHYFHLFKQHLKLYTLQKHLTKLKKLSRYNHWKKLNGQLIQEIAQRIKKGYLLFFQPLKDKRRKISPPKFRKRSKYSSITFKQTGFKYLGENRVQIGRDIYRFFLFRPVEDLIKGMMKLWGRKVSDYAFSEFISILRCVAKQYDGILYFCDRYFPGSNLGL